MRLATQNAYDAIGGREGGDGGGAGVFVDSLQIGLGFEVDVLGKFGLINTRPVTAKARLGQVIHERVDLEYFLDQRAWLGSNTERFDRESPNEPWNIEFKCS